MPPFGIENILYNDISFSLHSCKFYENVDRRAIATIGDKRKLL